MAEELSAEAKAKAEAETANAEELLKSLKLKDTEIETLRSNENLLNVIAHSLDAKRGANAEAKKYREELEALKSQQDAENKSKLEKKGEFEKLYQEANEKLSQKDQKIKDALIKGELARLAGSNGLAKAEYLRLLDASKLEVDLDTLTVKGAEEVFKSFKESNPELFKQAQVPGTDGGQPKIRKGEVGDLEELKALEIRAKNSGMPKDLARFKAKRLELASKGKI